MPPLPARTTPGQSNMDWKFPFFDSPSFLSRSRCSYKAYALPAPRLCRGSHPAPVLPVPLPFASLRPSLFQTCPPSKTTFQSSGNFPREINRIPSLLNPSSLSRPLNRSPQQLESLILPVQFPQTVPGTTPLHGTLSISTLYLKVPSLTHQGEVSLLERIPLRS